LPALRVSQSGPGIAGQDSRDRGDGRDQPSAAHQRSLRSGHGSARGQPAARQVLSSRTASRAHRSCEMTSGLGLARPLRAAGPKGAKARRAALGHGHHRGRPRGLLARFECRHRSRRACQQQRCLRRLPWQACCVPHRGRPGRSGGYSRRASGCGSRSRRQEWRQSVSSRPCDVPGVAGLAAAPATSTRPPVSRAGSPLPPHPRMFAVLRSYTCASTDRPGLHSMVATAPAGVVSLANRVSLQPAHQRLCWAATGDVILPALPPPAGALGRA
jgi:hypothetical protein